MIYVSRVSEKSDCPLAQTIRTNECTDQWKSLMKLAKCDSSWCHSLSVHVIYGCLQMRMVSKCSRNETNFLMTTENKQEYHKMESGVATNGDWNRRCFVPCWCGMLQGINSGHGYLEATFPLIKFFFTRWRVFCYCMLVLMKRNIWGMIICRLYRILN